MWLVGTVSDNIILEEKNPPYAYLFLGESQTMHDELKFFISLFISFLFFFFSRKVLPWQTSLEDIKSWLAQGEEGSEILQSGLSIIHPFVTFKYHHTILYTAMHGDVL